MKNNLTGLISILIAVLFFSAVVFSQTTEFSYQGRLLNASAPASGNYDFEFVLYDAVAGGVQIGSPLPRSSVAVANGDFSVKLDFGSQFPGANRFLEIRVRQTGGGAFTPLTPRQMVNSTPYSVQSLNAANATNAVNATNATNAVNATNAATAANALSLGGVAASQYVTTTSGNSSYIQNTTSPQASSNFNISGTGTAGGTLSGNIVNATTQFNIGGRRILSSPGENNMFVGINTGQSNTTGTTNSFFGSDAGSANTGGGFNSFFGSGAGTRNTTGIGNSYFGGSAGFSNINGVSNSFFGYGAGQANTTGGNNSFFGVYVGLGNETGANNTLFGANANVGSGNLNNATALGAGAIVSASNSLVLGDVGVKVGIGTTAPTFKLQVIDSSNTGLRVQTNTSGGTVASFGGMGSFQIDSPGWAGGRFTVLENGNVGIATANPNTKLQVAGGSVYIQQPNSLIITSPNGACWFITVNNAGTLSTISVTCP